MSIRFIDVLAVVIAMMNACAALAQAEPQPAQAADLATREVNVLLHFNIPEGMEVPENYVPDMSGGSDKRVYPGVRTGPADYTLSGSFPSSTGKVVVSAFEWFTRDRDFRSPSTVPQRDRHRALSEMIRRFSLGWPVEVLLVEGQTEYPVTIDLIPAIKVTGQFVLANGEQVGPELWRRGSANVMNSAKAEPGKFVAFGVPKGRATWLASMSSNAHLVYRLIHLTAAQTQSDLELGSIIVRPEDPSCPVDVTFTNAGLAQALLSRENDVMCLVSHDGTQCIDVSVVAGVGRYDTGDPARAPKIPKAYAENYFVIPGWFCASPIVEKVIEYCRDGRAAELIAAGIPTILPVEGQTTTLTIDATDVVNRVKALP